MGNCMTVNEDHELDIILKNDAKRQNEKIKLLLLGAGESGKSTVFKQMKIIYGDKTSKIEQEAKKKVIYDAVVATMDKLVINAGLLGEESNVLALDSLEQFKAFMKQAQVKVHPGPCWTIIQTLWQDPAIQAIWERRAEFQVIDSVRHYFDDIDRLSAVDYVPTDKDILLSRVRTTGIVTEYFKVGEKTYEIYDAGGQRSERRKWIDFFYDVTSVMFVAALSEYNQTLFEDNSVNRMTEALELFEDVIKNQCFRDEPPAVFILFLNKLDLFQEKIKKVPIKDTPEFADFTGGDNLDKACDYFKKKFQQKWDRVNRKLGGDLKLFIHFTQATDTSNVQQTFGICNEAIIQNDMKNCGM